MKGAQEMSIDSINPPQVQARTEYWGTDERFRYELEGGQFFECKVMNEGDKTKFQKSTNQDLTIGRDQTAKIKMDPASERHQLIKASVVGWVLYKDGLVVDFNTRILEQWLQVAPPKIVEDLEFVIRKNNPWMQAEMTTEEIDKEIERLYELRKQVVEREAGEVSSATK
jgi:hypothetical protein